MATATMRLLLRPLVTDHHHQPPFIIRCCWASGGVCSSSSSSKSRPGGAKAAEEKSKRRRKKKKKIGAADEHHLKRRTRSGAAFDRALYSRYASQHSDGGHVPVMLGEVLQAFSLPLTSFVDCTLGAAGHASAIIQAHPEMRLFLGLDMDPVAHRRAKTRIEALLGNTEKLTAYTHLRNYKYIKSVLAGIDDNILNDGVDGIFMDLGMSSMQVNHSDRGFSLLTDGPLDMRMDPQASLNAKEILNFWPEAEVGRVLRDYGEESNWRFLQRKIVNARKNGGLHSTSELVDLVRSTSANSGGRQGWIKTATRVFQALRIAVNDELQTLEDSLYACFDCLAPGGRLAVISFHSLEDRIVKQSFLDLIERGDNNTNSIINLRREEDEIGIEEGEEEEGRGAWMKQQVQVQGSNGSILTKRPITPTEEEERLNRRCTSAKLRVLQKT